MESHPEEYNHSEHQQQGNDALLGFCRAQFGFSSSAILSLGSLLLVVHISMLEGGTEHDVNGHRHDKRDTSHTKPIVVGARKLRDVGGTEASHIASIALCSLQLFEQYTTIGFDCSIQELMSQ